MTSVSLVYQQLEQRIIHDTKLKTTNGAVIVFLAHIRKFMQDTYWPEDAKSENDPALKVFNHLIDKLD